MELQSGCRFNKVMVIDDSHIDRYIAQRIISKAQFAENTELCESAREALGHLANCQSAADVPKVIFLDIRIPEMDGFEFLEHFNQLPALVRDNCMIAIISSSGDVSDQRRAETSPYVRCFIRKPLDKDKLNQYFVQ